MNNPFLLSIAGLTAALLLAILGQKVGHRLAERHIRKAESDSSPNESSEIATQRIVAPFTEEQVASLNGYQVSSVFHPFTCPERHYSVIRNHQILDEDEILSLEETQEFYILGDHILLVATEKGWHCPTQTCQYTQDWSWDFMANGAWKQMVVSFDPSETT